MRKIRLISKFIKSKTGKQIIAIHILPIISRSEGNQTMKFFLLIEYNMKVFFLKNHIQNVVKQVVPNLFRKNQN